jgi:hypothetical protein
MIPDYASGKNARDIFGLLGKDNISLLVKSK